MDNSKVARSSERNSRARRFRLLVPGFILMSSACSPANPPATNYTIGGLGGTVAGAGIGAIIGSAISNGDVAASAGLGAAIGLPTGLLLNYLLVQREASQQERERNSLARTVERNQQRIAERDRLLDEEWQRLRSATPQVDEERLPADIYYGPRSGDPRRN